VTKMLAVSLLSASLLSASLLAAPALAQEHGEEHEAVAHEDGAHEDGAHEEHAAAGHGEAHVNYTEFGAMILNFFIWAAIIVLLLRKPLVGFLQGRRVAVEEGLEESKRLTAAANAKYKDYSERLERLDEELEKLRREMIQAGEAERDRIVQEAEARATRMRKDAQFLIEQQMKQLRVDLTREAIEAAVSHAEKVLLDKTSTADQERLANDYLSSLERELDEKDRVRA
jgi:F0F1-type ATP synthase membrane subunit b/b'